MRKVETAYRPNGWCCWRPLLTAGDPAVAGKLAERLAGKVGDQLVLFAQYMQEGLLAASVAIGLDVMAEFMEATPPPSPAPRAATTLPVPPTATATSRPPSPSAGAGWR